MHWRHQAHKIAFKFVMGYLNKQKTVTIIFDKQSKGSQCLYQVKGLEINQCYSLIDQLKPHHHTLTELMVLNVLVKMYATSTNKRPK